MLGIGTIRYNFTDLNTFISYVFNFFHFSEKKRNIAKRTYKENIFMKINTQR